MRNGMKGLYVLIVILILILVFVYTYKNEKETNEYNFKTYFFNAGKADAILLEKNMVNYLTLYIV